MEQLKRFVRDNEKMMFVLAFFYRIFGLNQIKGRRGLRLQWSGSFCKRFRIINHGRNNKILIGKGCRFRNCNIEIYGNNNQIEIANDCVGHGLEIWISEGSQVEIKEHSHFAGKSHLAATEGRKISIGERCLFASEIVFRTGDSHSILDLEGKRLNPAKDIHVDNHVWIGQHVTVLKGTEIGNDCIVGINSLLTGKKFVPNCVIAGNPAKVIKQGVTWHHDFM